MMPDYYLRAQLLDSNISPCTHCTLGHYAASVRALQIAPWSGLNGSYYLLTKAACIVQVH
jgi:hypothetical protein